MKTCLVEIYKDNQLPTQLSIDNMSSFTEEELWKTKKFRNN